MTAAVLSLGRRLRTGDGLAWRRAGGGSIAIMGLVVLAAHGVQALTSWAQTEPGVSLALQATLGTALATGLGALPLLLLRRISERLSDTLMGAGAGIMLAAAVFSLLLPALDQAEALYGTATRGAAVVALGLGLGAALLLALDRLLPHRHFVSGDKSGANSSALAQRAQGLWLFVFAIALHNLPEGLAVGVSVNAQGQAAGALTLGIALQNMPEGLIVALAMQTLGFRPVQAVLAALATGLMEPVGGLLGVAMVGSAQLLMPVALALAAGAMLFVVSHEIIPESHRNGHETDATIGLLAGFVAMLMMSAALG